MCRFLVYWGIKSHNLSGLILTEENSLFRQSQNDCTNRPNPDGWGFAYRIGKYIKLIKSPAPAFEDQKYFPTAKEIHSDLLFAHVRRKSQGVVSYENTHPFVQNRWMFMHNGNVPGFNQSKTEILRKLPKDCEIQTLGSTDSEFLFNYFLYRMQKNRKSTLQDALNIISTIIHQVIELTSQVERHQLALNFMLTNGHFMIGFRRNRTLFYRVSENETIISSEKLDSMNHWNEVPENHFIIGSKPGQVELVSKNISLTKLEYQHTC
jgi:predicted glutamine amidotransferase